jgi:hypothetical protein
MFFPNKSFTGTVCSSHGGCEYSDPSGSILDSCTVLDTTCDAECQCDTGFGGADCSLSSFETAQRDSVRWHTIIDKSAIQ